MAFDSFQFSISGLAAALRAMARKRRGHFHTSDYGFTFDANPANPSSLSGQQLTDLNNAIAANNAAMAALLADIAVFAPSATKYATLFFDSTDVGGRIVLSTPFRVPRYCNVACDGTELIYSGTDFTGPFVTLGESLNKTSGAGGGVFDLPVTRCSRFTTHRWSPRNIDRDHFAAYKIELVHARLHFRGINGFGVGIQFMPKPGCFTAHNTTTIGTLSDCCTLVDFRGNVAGVVAGVDDAVGWANENAIVSWQNGAFSAGWNFYNGGGGGTAIRYSVETGGYGGLSGNDVIEACLQLGAPVQLVNGASISADHTRMNGGRDYLALNSGTATATMPTHTDGSDVLIGSITWRDLGVSRRQPVLFHNSGSRNEIYLRRLEGWYGMPVAIRGAGNPSGDGSTVRIRNAQSGTLPSNTALGYCTGVEFLLDDPTTAASGGAGILVTIHNEPPETDVQMPPLITSLIGSASGIAAFNGYSWTNATDTGRVRNVSTNETMRLCTDGVVLTAGGGADSIGVMCPVTADSSTVVARLNRGMDAVDPPRLRSKTFTKYGTATGISGRAKVVVQEPSALPIAGNTYAAPGDSYISRAIQANAPDVGYIWVGGNSGKMASVGVTRRHTQITTQGGTQVGRPADVDTTFSPRVPHSPAAPTLGYFPVKTRVVDSTNATNGWDCSAGWLSEAWASGMSLIPNLVVINSGNAYVAITTTAVTGGSTAPTGTSATAPTGGGEFLYIGPASTVTAV